MLSLHILELCIQPPERYPDIYPALFSIFGAANFTAALIVFVIWQHSLPLEDPRAETRQSLGPSTDTSNTSTLQMSERDSAHLNGNIALRRKGKKDKIV
jgi:hypothetical protein